MSKLIFLVELHGIIDLNEKSSYKISMAGLPPVVLLLIVHITEQILQKSINF